ncbi:cupin domain-containing protein [Reichenbachiella ulvae]|uniref:Cupin domain-containing protein n=1 Tax=Reichenbachiella ulvae TaxID=2980104 RepID=A0ABT3CP73_9BACT|nr:cupin domain-containing protein [Reichenbachiella ulvae]MCV9385402.1 cupin domain-containing protein [Reichenbachiella ulvae]
MILAFGSQAQNLTPESSIDECVNELNMDSTKTTKSGYQYWFIGKEDLDGRTIKMSVVGPGKSTHAPHQHVEDEFFYILEGKAEFYLNGETRIAGPNTSLYCPSMSMHGLKNVGQQELKYLVLKKYQMQE